MALTRPDYRQIANIEENVEKSSTTNAVYQRSIVAEIPLWDDYALAFRNDLGQTPYPQSFAFDDVTDELFVLRSAGSPATAHIWVYDVDPDSRQWALKTIFHTGKNWSESLVIRWVGGVRWLYSLDGSVGASPGTGAMYRCNITTLPAELAMPAVIETFPGVVGSTQMSFDGSTFAVQRNRPFKGFSSRFIFDLWSADLTKRLGEVDFTYAVNGSVSSPYAELRNKSQGIAMHNGNYAFACGGDIVTGVHDPDDAYLHQGIIICGTDGRRLAGGLCRPDEFIRIRNTDPNGLSYAGNMSEVEGLSVYKGELHALWMTTSPLVALTAGHENEGFIITREMSQTEDRIDFRPASRVVPTWDPERFGAIVHQPAGHPINPVTMAPMDTFVKICTFMKDGALSRFQFFGNSTLKDLNNVDVPVASMFVDVKNGNGSTFLITITSLYAADSRSFWIYNLIGSQAELNDTRYS